MSLTPKNWDTFQHYRDRAPPWIKLHRTLLDNVDYARLSPDAGKALPLVWLVASDGCGILPDAPELAFRLRIAEDLASKILVELVESGFLVEASDASPAEQRATPSQQVAKSNGFGSRHISDAVKRAVFERDGGKCCACGSDDNIEYDHKVPVSKGGNSSSDNIQLLCRACNRRKRTRLAAPAEQVATEGLGSCILETEGERELEAKTETEAKSASIEGDRTARAPSRFDEFWKKCPRREGPNPRKPAETKFNALVKSGVDPQMLIDEADKWRGAESSRGNVGTRFVAQIVTWLGQQRWADHAAVAFLADEELPRGLTIEQAVEQFARFGRWSKYAPGPEPGQSGCLASPELFAKYGLGPDGRKLEGEAA